MSSRLHLEDPDLDRHLATLPSEQLRVVALAAADWIVSRFHFSTSLLSDALSAARTSPSDRTHWRRQVEREVEKLDGLYLDLAEAQSSGDADEAEYLVAFGRARAASAVAYALADDPHSAAAEAIYEALAATDEFSLLRAALQPLL